jgi:hypothetical protein
MTIDLQIRSAEQLEIANLQQELVDLGWQFRETVFNDGMPNNCFLQVTRDKSPTAFADYKDVLGWGRFKRLLCWQQALEAVRGYEKKAKEEKLCQQ